MRQTYPMNSKIKFIYTYINTEFKKKTYKYDFQFTIEVKISHTESIFNSL